VVVATARVQHWRERVSHSLIGKGCLVFYPLPTPPLHPQYQPSVPARNCARSSLSRFIHQSCVVQWSEAQL
jgi:hypothetical protein